MIHNFLQRLYLTQKVVKYEWRLNAAVVFVSDTLNGKSLNTNKHWHLLQSSRVSHKLFDISGCVRTLTNILHTFPQYEIKDGSNNFY